METPAEIVSQYTPRVMIEALIQAPRPSTFLLDRLIKRTTEHDTDIIEIDVEKGSETLAAYVSPVGEANVVGKRDFESNIHALPYVYEEIPFTAKDLEVRLPGSTVYLGKGPKQRLDEKVAGWLATLSDRMMRREEQQIAEAIQTGKIVVSGRNVNYTVDFRMNASHIVVNTGADLWDSGTDDKINQLEVLSELTRVAGAPGITDIYMGIDAAKEWLKDTVVLANLDNRRVEIGEINPVQLAEQKATFLGTLNRIGLQVNIYSYQATYTDEQGAKQYFIDPKKIVMVAGSARFEKHYGVIKNLKHGSFIGKQFPDMVIDPKGRVGSISLESGPLVGLHQPDGVVVVKVLA